MKNRVMLSGIAGIFLVSLGLVLTQTEAIAAITPKNKSAVSSLGDKVETKDLHRKDGKADTWIHTRNGKIYLKEFDRNFDGKPDLQIFELNGRFTEKKYDDNFDGKYDRTEKALPKGSSGITPTSPRA